MTKIVSITMAIIIMLTVGANAEMITPAATQQIITASVKAKPSSHTNKKKKKHKHMIPKGNMKRWFKSRKALKKYVNKVMKKYNCQYENGKITWDEYVRRCPYGYEAWSCSCGKWTGNFKYHKVRSIDINYYIKYARSYGKQIGLEYDKTATDCWDNPITVTTKNKNAVERDIKSRLDRYRNIEGFEGICVWAHTNGGDEYLLYIGYC